MDHLRSELNRIPELPIGDELTDSEHLKISSFLATPISDRTPLFRQEIKNIIREALFSYGVMGQKAEKRDTLPPEYTNLYSEVKTIFHSLDRGAAFNEIAETLVGQLSNASPDFEIDEQTHEVIGTRYTQAVVKDMEHNYELLNEAGEKTEALRAHLTDV
ncbi:MAG: hypothetical protein MRY21_01240 [Simkaniaceae bacterium]|nr:hypothetical protein [Simkaniaceae bacterium]